MKNKMTEKQKSLVKDNIGLMYSFIRNNKEAGVIPHYLTDDFMSDLALRFCRSAINFEEKKGFQFSTFVYGGFKMCCKDIKGNKERYYFRNNFMDTDVVSSIKDNKEQDRNEVDRDSLFYIMSKAGLSEQEILAIRLYFFDKESMLKISAKIGLCKTRVYQIINKSVEKIRKIVSKENMSMADFYNCQ